MQPRRIFIYVQHLSGVGHTVRMQRVGRALAARHRVCILDGGRPLPFPESLERLEVPRLVRRDGALASLDPALGLSDALDARGAALGAWVDTNAPDAILVEHFPFSKWELAGEITALLARARAANPALRAIASLRDICPPTRHEDRDTYDDRVIDWLRDFDGLLVHGDPDLARLEDYFPARARIPVPVHYTGIVTDIDTKAGADETRPLTVQERARAGVPGPYVVASAGGGSDAARVLPRVERAWRELAGTGELGECSLLLFGAAEGGCAKPGERGNDGVKRMPFDTDFPRWLRGAALSVSAAGYNTCAELLAAGTPALLIPNTRMSDQAERGRLLAARGLATLVPPPVEGEDPLLRLLPAALRESLCGEPPRWSRQPASLDLDGAAGSLRCVEALLSGAQLQ